MEEVPVRQDRLFRLAVESIHIHAHHEPGRGWVLSCGIRRGDESWTDVRPELYDRLTTPEMADVISVTLAHQLGL